MLGDTTTLLLERDGGDLRRLRQEVERDLGEERRLLKEVKGIGDVGVDIFFREAQREWVEVRPFAGAGPSRRRAAWVSARRHSPTW